MLFAANENLFISDNGLFRSPFLFVLVYPIKSNFKPPFPGYQTMDRACIHATALWISGAEKANLCTFHVFLLIPNKIKTAYEPLDKIGLREVHTNFTQKLVVY